MSRIGNDPINIPEGVTVQFDNNTGIGIEIATGSIFG